MYVLSNQVNSFFLLEGVFLGLNQDYYTVSESDGYLEVCVTLSNHTERVVMASLFAILGTASGITQLQHYDRVYVTIVSCSLDDDFSGLPQVLTFSEAGEQCINVTITMDNFLEEPEKFYVVLDTRDPDVKFELR